MTPPTERWRSRLLLLLAAAFLSAGLAASCGSNGSEPVGYVTLPEAIVIQSLTVSGAPQSRVERRTTVPEFTLYGNGTLIFLGADADGEQRLLEAELPASAIRGLVQSIADEGFLAFPYELPEADSVPDAPITYLYVNTKAGVNSTRAYALGVGDFEAAGDKFDDLRSLVEIKKRIDAVDPVALGGRVIGPYEHERVALFVRPLDANDDGAAGAAPWPSPAVDLASLAPDGPGVSKTVVNLSRLAEVIGTTMLGAPSGFFSQDGRAYEVGWRPALPFEENFPEFDFPAAP